MTVRVKIMADYCSTGVWDADTYEMLEPQDLGISDSVINDLAEFCAIYDKNCQDYLPESERTAAYNYAEHDARAKRIAQQIKAQRPDWDVYFFSEERLLLKNESSDLLIKV